MARRTITIDERIERAEAEVVKYKSKYEKALTDLKELVDKKRAMKNAEVISAIEKSSRTYEEILEFLKGGKATE